MADTSKPETAGAKKGDAVGVWAGVLWVLIFIPVMAFMNWHPSDADKKDLAATAAVCQMEAICSDYPAVRDVCAAAGSFEKCMEVKYGSRQRYDLARESCTNDGAVAMDPAKVPGFLDCWEAKLKGP